MTRLCFIGKIRRSCFHKHKHKEVSDNEIMFANQWQVTYGVISCFLPCRFGEIPWGQGPLEQVYHPGAVSWVLWAGSWPPGARRELQAESPDRRALRERGAGSHCWRKLGYPISVLLKLSQRNKSKGGLWVLRERVGLELYQLYQVVILCWWVLKVTLNSWAAN